MNLLPDEYKNGNSVKESLEKYEQDYNCKVIPYDSSRVNVNGHLGHCRVEVIGRLNVISKAIKDTGLIPVDKLTKNYPVSNSKKVKEKSQSVALDKEENTKLLDDLNFQIIEASNKGEFSIYYIDLPSVSERLLREQGYSVKNLDHKLLGSRYEISW